MNGGKTLDKVEIVLRGSDGSRLPIYVDIFDNSLSRKWLAALNAVLLNQSHLEKNYCFFGFIASERNGPYLLDQINRSIHAINNAGLGYYIDDIFDMDNVLTDEPTGQKNEVGRNLVHDKLNQLHRYFEDLQGTSGCMSAYYLAADPVTRWHIRQLNLLCHEFESWALTYRKQIEAPEWQRPSQLMCWLPSPRFQLEPEDYELFGIDTISRPLGGVFVGVNKAVGKHHWEVFNDEGRDSRLGELVTGTLRSQTEAAADFDIEWGRNPAGFEWQKRNLQAFRDWLIDNKFDPDDPSLTIGHPQIGQVDLLASFGTDMYQSIWKQLSQHLDVFSVATGSARANYDYRWSDHDYCQQQLIHLGGP